MRTPLLFAALLLATTGQAQTYDYDQGSTTWSGTINHTASTSFDADAQARYQIRYAHFMGEPLLTVVATPTVGSNLRYEGQTYPLSSFPEGVRRAIEHGLVDLTWDIYSGRRRVSTVRATLVLPSDSPTSPDWDGVFPDVSEDRAKDLFRNGFSVRNVRVTDWNLKGQAALQNHFRDQEREAERERQREEAAQEPPQTADSRQEETAAEERRQPEPGAGAQTDSRTGAATGAQSRSGASSQTAAAQPATGARTDRESNTARLSPNAQSRLRSTLSSARQAERDGHYDTAIRLYQSANGIDPQPWIPGKIDELRNRRRVQAEAEQERIKAGADAIATAAIATGQALAPVVDEMSAGYAANFVPGDNRRFEFELIRAGLAAVTNEYTRINRSGEPGRTTSFETMEFNFSSALAVNAWLPYTGASGRSLLGFRASGRAGFALSFPPDADAEDAIGEDAVPLFEEHYLTYAYGGGVVLNEMVSVGYENRSISAVPNEGSDIVPLTQRTRHYGYVEVAPSFNRSMPLTLRVASALTGGCGAVGDGGVDAPCFAQSGLNHVLVEARLPMQIGGAFGLTYERFERSARVTRSVVSLTMSMLLR